jgi:hypothetical protein
MNTLLKQKVVQIKDAAIQLKYDLDLTEEKIKMKLQHLEENEKNKEEEITVKQKELKENESHIIELQSEIETIQKTIDELMQDISDKTSVESKNKKLIQLESKIENNIQKIEKDIEFYHDNDNCPTCRQNIEEEFKVNQIKERESKVEEQKKGLDQIKEEINASLAGIGMNKESFYLQVKELFNEFFSELAPLTLQWLPPYAWYFGGSIQLTNVNNIKDVEWINKFGLPITLDSSHLLLGQTAFGFDPKEIIKAVTKNIIHWHISDSLGLDGEGLPIGVGGPENEALISEIIDQSGLKVIEVWQGHFYNFEGFKVAINKIAEMKGAYN